VVGVGGGAAEREGFPGAASARPSSAAPPPWTRGPSHARRTHTALSTPSSLPLTHKQVTALHRHGGPLLRLLKAAAKAHGATDTTEGGLNSWCLAQLALHCLQTSGPAPERLPALSMLFSGAAVPSGPRLCHQLSEARSQEARDDLIAAAGEVMLQAVGRLNAQWGAAARAAAAPAELATAPTPLAAGRTPLNPGTSLLQATAGMMEHLAALLGGWARGKDLGRRVSTWLGGLSDGAPATALAARAPSLAIAAAVLRCRMRSRNARCCPLFPRLLSAPLPPPADPPTPPDRPPAPQARSRGPTA